MSENDENVDTEVATEVSQKEENDRKRREERERRHRRRDEREKDRARERSHRHSDVTSKRKDRSDENDDDREEKEKPPKKKKISPEEENLLTRTGGAYIPPAKLRLLQSQITDKTSTAFQRFAWEALKKSLNGLINKVNVSNVSIIIRELFRENVIRGRGLLARSILQAQAASPTFTHVYACFVAIINSKFPQIGELILKRLIIQFRLGYRRNDKQLCLSSTRFIAHLVNQQVAHELLALEILTLLLETPTDDGVEVAIGFLKENGMKLTEVTPRGMNAVFERLRSILHEGNLDKRVQYMIEVMFAIRKDKFLDHPITISELDIVEEADQYTHLMKLDETMDPENMLNVFKHDTEYEETEEKYKAIRKDILDEASEDGSGDEDESGDDDEEDEEDEDQDEKEKLIIDSTETNLVSLRRTIYLTIQSSLDFEECAHKLLKMELKPGQESELCHMILDCCAQQRTYEKFFGLLGQRFCQLNKIYVTPFEQIFIDSYDTIHRLETNKLRNVAKFFSHLLYTDAIGWMVLSHIRLNEEDTTSSSRIFIKILFQELSEYMGLPRLNERLKDATLQEAFEGLFPRDNPRNSRFAINFFTSIGLGGLTDELREHLKTQAKPPAPTVQPTEVEAPSSPEESSSESEDSESDSDSSDSSGSSESEPDKPVSKNRKNKSKMTSKHSNKRKKEEKSKEKKKHKQDRREERENRREERENRREERENRRDERENRQDERENGKSRPEKPSKEKSHRNEKKKHEKVRHQSPKRRSRN